VVTGGATGIGRTMCLRFAGEGAAVVVNFSKSRFQAEELVGEIESSGGRALAVQALAPEIRVNAIAPGFVDTGIVNWTPEVLAELQNPTRLGNRISPEDVADAAVYLATLPDQPPARRTWWMPATRPWDKTGILHKMDFFSKLSVFNR